MTRHTLQIAPRTSNLDVVAIARNCGLLGEFTPLDKTTRALMQQQFALNTKRFGWNETDRARAHALADRYFDALHLHESCLANPAHRWDREHPPRCDRLHQALTGRITADAYTALMQDPHYGNPTFRKDANAFFGCMINNSIAAYRAYGNLPKDKCSVHPLTTHEKFPLIHKGLNGKSGACTHMGFQRIARRYETGADPTPRR